MIDGPRGDSTGDLLAALTRRLRHGFVEALAAFDVTPAQARALRVVDERGPLRLSGLADDLRIAPRSATEVVDALEARGLVVRRPDPADRRAVVVRVTPEGSRVRAQADQVREARSEELLGRLSEADRNELDRLLRLLSQEW